MSAHRKHQWHGRTGTPEHNAWNDMLKRCFNKTSQGYERYGGRGITVCERWTAGFLNFLSDMGERPSPLHSLDRIDNDGNYEPSNCRWAIAKVQQRNRAVNRMVTVDGVTKCAAEWEEESGVPAHRIANRIKNGWDPRRAVFEPIQAKHSRHWTKCLPCNVRVYENEIRCPKCGAIVEQKRKAS